MERKSKGKVEEYANFSIRIPEKLVWEIEAIAAKQNRSRNNMIEQLLWHAVSMASDTHDPSLE
jgi:metal-responsive CopG/Arc/MetJ family transcriptional regulator